METAFTPVWGKALEMDKNLARDSIVEQSNVHWKDTMDFDLDGEEFINFLGETADRNEWGGARQVAIFSRIANVRIDIHSVGNVVQTFEFYSSDEVNKRTISVLWCNIKKWGGQTVMIYCTPSLTKS
eukprot:13227552-Heterocapsa_arctica.AAC.1